MGNRAGSNGLCGGLSCVDPAASKRRTPGPNGISPSKHRSPTDGFLVLWANDTASGQKRDLPGLRADAMEQEATRLKTEANHQVKAALADHAYGIFPNGVTYSWKEQHRAGYTVAPAVSRVLRRTAQKGLMTL